jgi:enoyl-CoA hydratase
VADDVLIDGSGPVGRIVLNRPRALNALTHDMIRRIDAALLAWVDAPAIRTVLISGAGERGLCAGGDIRAIHDDLVAGGRESLRLWRDEYVMDARIARYPKPVVALMDGLVMGGGVGLAGHAAHRVVTERTAVAMPEVGIGLAPDCGGTWLLARAPGELGTYAALTGARLGAADTIALGLADRFVPAAELPALVDALLAGEPPAAAIERLARPPGRARLPGRRGWIDGPFGAPTAEGIAAALRRCGLPEAGAAAAEIGRKSPTAVKVTITALRRARAMGSLEEALDQEFRVTTRCFAGPDLREGIRAAVVDKDRSPRWSPASLEQVAEAAVLSHFEPLGQDELGLAAQPGR